MRYSDDIFRFHYYSKLKTILCNNLTAYLKFVMNTTATSDSSFKQGSEWTSGLLAGLLLGIIITIIIMFLLKRRRRRRQLTTTINLGKGRDSRHIRRIKLAAKSHVDLQRSVTKKIIKDETVLDQRTH